MTSSLSNRLLKYCALSVLAVATLLSPQVARAQPQLSSVMPPNGATNVSVGTALDFTFHTPMNQFVPILTYSLPPFLLANVAIEPSGSIISGTFSDEGLTLTCPNSSAFPPGTTVTWTLNPPGATFALTDELGAPLATVSGSFTTAGSGGDCNPDGIPDTWGGYSLFKSANYLQTSTADPVPVEQLAFSLHAYVEGPDAGPPVTDASLTLPNATQTNLFPLALGSFSLNRGFDTQWALDTAYPPGPYTLRFTQTGQPERVIPMTMPAGGPPVPKVANYPQAQSVNAAEDFTLEWNAFNNPGAGAAIHLRILDPFYDTVFQAPDYCVPRELLVTDTAIVIPGGTLESDQIYDAYLSFEQSFYQSTNTVVEMAGYGGVHQNTQFTINTGVAVTVEAGSWTGWRLLPNGNPQLDFTGTPLETYTVQRTTGLMPAGWTAVGAVTPDALGNGTFEDTQGGKVYPLYYRTVINP